MEFLGRRAHICPAFVQITKDFFKEIRPTYTPQATYGREFRLLYDLASTWLGPVLGSKR